MLKFRIIGIALVLWNLIGVAAFAMQISADPVAMAKTDHVTAEAFGAMPWWAWTAYAIAVLAGTAGSIALLLRHRMASALFQLSLVAVVVQFGWSFLGFDLITRKGWSTLAFPLVIAAITLAAALYARAKLRNDALG